jgi:uncharacterized protein YndB with AHSA1/START domain
MAIDVQSDADIRRPASEVFTFLADGENMPRWMGIFETVKKVSEGPVGKGTTYHYRMARRGKAESDFEWSEYEPNRRLSWHGPPISTGPGSLEPSGEYLLTEHNGATHVTMRMHPKTTGLMSLMSPLMARSMRKEAAGNMQRLKEVLESEPGGQAAAAAPA